MLINSDGESVAIVGERVTQAAAARRRRVTRLEVFAATILEEAAASSMRPLTEAGLWDRARGAPTKAGVELLRRVRSEAGAGRLPRHGAAGAEVDAAIGAWLEVRKSARRDLTEYLEQDSADVEQMIVDEEIERQDGEDWIKANGAARQLLLAAEGKRAARPAKPRRTRKA